MSAMTIVIGNKNYSSWSLRGWIALEHSGAEFDEVVISLRKPSTRAEILVHSPAGKVPILHDGDVTVWESLAVCEYLAEKFPAARLWPEDPVARAHARAVSTEMHGGFADLRRDMPLNCRAHRPGRGATLAALTDVARIAAIWDDCRSRHGAEGDFLFGHFTVADAMYAPVASRFATYEPGLGATTRAYVEAMHALPAMQKWVEAARAEAECLVEMEI